SRYRAAHFVHRRVPRRNGGGFPRVERFRSRSRIRLAGSVLLLGHGGFAELWPGHESGRRDRRRAAPPPDGNPKGDLRAEAAQAYWAAVARPARRPVEGEHIGLGSPARSYGAGD